MKPPYIIGLIVGAIIIIAGSTYLFLASTQKEPSMKREEPMMKTEEKMMEPTQAEMMEKDSMMEEEEKEIMEKDTMMMKSPRYTPYSPDVLSSASANRRVLFFYANWCPTCIPADKAFEESSAQIPADVTVIRVNYNDTETDANEKELAKQYGITYQHTFVQIDTDGNEVTTWNGGGIDELTKNIQ